MKGKILAPATSIILLTGMAAHQAFAQTQPGDSDPRHVAIYNLMQAGKAREALTQLNAVPNPGAWDFYMRGQACQLIGEPVKAAEWFKTAVAQDAQNDLYRTKAVDSLLLLSKCDEAIQLCSDGSKLMTDAKRKQRYDDKIKDIEKLKQNYATAAENIARHKREHAAQLQQAMEAGR